MTQHPRADVSQRCTHDVTSIRGRVAAVRTLPRGDGARLEVDAGLAETNSATPDHLAAEDLDALLVVGTFLRRPPPELRVVPLEREAIFRAAA